MDQLLDMSMDQLLEMMDSRVRRRFRRGLKRKHMALLKKLRGAKKEASDMEKPAVVKTHLRNMVIVPEMVGSMVGVYNGKVFNSVEVKPEMTGFRCMLHLHAVVAECEVSKLIEAADPRTKKKETPPKFVKAPMVVLCVLILTQEAEFPMDTSGGRFCRFSLRTDGATIAIGKVAELPKVK